MGSGQHFGAGSTTVRAPRSRDRVDSVFAGRKVEVDERVRGAVAMRAKAAAWISATDCAAADSGGRNWHRADVTRRAVP